MKQAEQARLFLRKAAEDESLLDAILTLPGVSDAIFGFHCQQTAEKLLKAVLSYHRIAFFRTRDLQELMELLEAAGHPVPPEASGADELTPFAVQLRYDDLSPTYPVDRQNLRELIRHLRQFAEREIGPPSA